LLANPCFHVLGFPSKEKIGLLLLPLTACQEHLDPEQARFSFLHFFTLKALKNVAQGKRSAALGPHADAQPMPTAQKFHIIKKGLKHPYMDV